MSLQSAIFSLKAIGLAGWYPASVTDYGQLRWQVALGNGNLTGLYKYFL